MIGKGVVCHGGPLKKHSVDGSDERSTASQLLEARLESGNATAGLLCGHCNVSQVPCQRDRCQVAAVPRRVNMATDETAMSNSDEHVGPAQHDGLNA